MLGYGSVFQVHLAYHIQMEKIFVIKKIKTNINDSEASKLIKREIINYTNLNHPLIPKYIGTLNKQNGIVIEFVNGPTLDNIKKIKLEYDEILSIVYELMLIVQYFHSNKYIYRDLKPNNIIINENKTIVLIDYDRMINDEIAQSTTDHTNIFSSIFVAPEVNTGSFSNKCDLYSLGKIIEYIINEVPHIVSKNSYLAEIYKKCINEDPQKRPPISEIINEFYNQYCLLNINIEKYNLITQNMIINPKDENYHYKIGLFYLSKSNKQKNITRAINHLSLAANEGHLISQFNLGIIYTNNQFKNIDVNKAIYYFTLAANQGIKEAQYNLGIIYSDPIYNKRDINKSINYLALASNQNYYEAQFQLAMIYYYGEFFQPNIEKAIYYLTLAAKHNIKEAQFNLGHIYYSKKYNKKDISKAVYYFTLAANHNDPHAQYYLGIIEYNGEYGNRNINKAMNYFLLSAKQNEPSSQYFLGLIYYEGIHVTRDIYRAIYYFTLAANQNESNSQFYLGLIYYNGQCIDKDINKAIFYLKLSANQNNQNAQFVLGYIYSNYFNIQENINIAIHYYEQAANQNDSRAQFNLFMIYINGKYVDIDIEKAIKYLTLAANQNDENAQYFLGVFYYYGVFTSLNIHRGIYLLTQSANNGCIAANFIVGFIYHEGKNIERNMEKSLHYYKEASSFNNVNAKNNLGIIYRHGYNNEIKKNIGAAIEYLDEANRKANNAVIKYNLAHIYIYEELSDNKFDMAIKLLIESSILGFQPSQILLTLVLIKAFDANFDSIIQKIKNYTDEIDLIVEIIVNTMQDLSLNDIFTIDLLFQKLGQFDLIFNHFYEFIPFQKMNLNHNIHENSDSQKVHPITKDFYLGFGLDLIDSSTNYPVT